MADHNNPNNTNTGPQFSIDLAERLVDEAEIQVSYVRLPTPDFAEGAQIDEWNPTGFEIVNIFKRTKVLGVGASGKVYLEHCISGARVGQARAVKVLKYNQQPHSAQMVADLRRRELLPSIFLSQPWCEQHFVKVHNWFEIDAVPYLGMELLQGDLGKCQLGPRGRLAPDQARVVMAQLFSAVQYLHSQQLAHRDIKPENIMVHSMPPFQPQWIIKLGDFGNMEYYADVNAKRPIEVGGTHGYVPPDVLGYLPSDEASTYLQACKADMFAAGVLLFVMLTKKVPFGKEGAFLGSYARGEQAPGFPFSFLTDTQCGEYCTELIQLLLAVRPTGRPMASDCLQNCKWFQGL